MAWIGIGVFLLFIAPVRAGVLLRWEEGRLTGAVGLTLWGVRAQVRLFTQRDAQGRMGLQAALGRHLLPLSLPRGKKGAFPARMLLSARNGPWQWAVKRECFRVDVRFGCRDAAMTALLAGFLQALNGALPQAVIRCRPAFQGSAAVQVRYTARTRLGMLWGAYLLWRLRRRNEKEESKQWSIPSET